MNNFTKTESLPKTGHVNEVCKEWLVREDGALAYKLQSQEINDFYKGNRFRNAVVREDFPTALHEQIKEKEHADKQSEAYRRRLMEQEEHDKQVANEIADKLDRDIQEQQQRELHESEIIAQQMQEIYVNLPPPPPVVRDKSRPPPRPAKASIQHQQANSNEPSTSNGRYHKQHSHQHQHHQQLQQQAHHQNQPLLLKQQHFTNSSNGYVGLSLSSSNMAEMPTTPQRQQQQQKSQQQQQQQIAPNTNHLLVSDESLSPTQQSFNQFVELSKMGRTPPALTNDNFTNSTHQQFHQHRHQHASPSSSSSSSSAAAGAVRRNVFDAINTPIPIIPNSPQHTPHSPTNTLLHTTTPPPMPMQSLHPDIDELVEYSLAVDSIRRYDNSASTSTTNGAHDAPDSPSSLHSSSGGHSNFTGIRSPSHENLLRTDKKFQKLSPEKYDQLVGNEDMALLGAAGTSPTTAATTERHMQQHADDIELYVDPCDYASLKEIGLPMEEIKEMSKKLKQEQKDELLARRLQQMESHDGLSQEERDRLLAIEAQDKELAKMLQEREKAKAKRAKEKARLRKSQQKDTPSSSSTLCSTSNGLHCGPLLPLPQDCMSFAKHSSSSSAVSTNGNPHAHVEEDPLELEAYSNPIDVLHNQRMQNGTLTNGSLSRDSTNSNPRHGSLNRDDDIYTLPVDNCRPGHRPASLNIGPESGHLLQHNSMTRSENYSLESHDSLNGHDISPRMNYSKSGSFDQNSSPTPPYMPIQGTRRSNSSEDRKKKSKDKCTHQ